MEIFKFGISVFRFSWNWLKDLFSVLKPCRFSVLALVVVAIFLLAVPQGQEALRGLGEDKSFGKDFVELGVFTFITFVWAYFTWDGARKMLQIRFVDTPPDTPRILLFRKEIPRILGVLAIVIIGLSLWVSAYAYDHTNSEAASTLRKLALLQLSVAALFYVYVWKRRSILKLPSVEGLNLVSSFEEFGKGSKLETGLYIVLALICFAVFTLAPVRAAPHLGAATVLLLAAATWVPVGNVLVYVGSYFKFPVMTILLLIAIGISGCNDNHRIRIAKGGTLPPHKSAVSDYASRWLNSREEAIKANPQYPLIIVAAEGGGIRAAYWTAAVLTSLQDKYPNFANHTFALSGVSGGSLGIGMFDLLVKEQKEGNNFSNCSNNIPNNRLFNCSSDILSRDFLSPTLASMLYPDLLQRFWPVGIASFDRATTLEEAWEESWAKSIGNKRLSEPFHDLWKDDVKAELPALFLNSTSVETGKRVIFSNLSVSGETDGRSEFVDVFDAQAIIKKDVPFSTAIHGSARFTYVSPAGTVLDGNTGDVWGHIVDGGYFENSGAATASEILAAVLKEAETRKIRNNIVPIVIMISNNPTNNNPQYNANEQFSPSVFGNEVLSPLNALLNTRNARGSYAQVAIEREVVIQGGEYIHVGLEKNNKVPLPLGWMISLSARDEINKQLSNELIRENGIGEKIGHYLSHL